MFEVGRDGKAKVRNEISQGDILVAETARINCPSGAISIIDDWLKTGDYKPWSFESWEETKLEEDDYYYTDEK